MKVLVVDDEQLVRRSLARAFRLKKYEVIEAEDGKKGLELWIEHKPEIVVLDVLMPGLSGPQVVSERGPQNDSKVIMISAYSGEHDVTTITGEGIDLFIPKPFDDIFKVVERIEEVAGVR